MQGGGEGDEEYHRNPNPPNIIVAVMSSVGVFRKVEKDEKSYWIYTLTHPDEALAMDPFFLCPRARLKLLKLKLNMPVDDDDDDEDDDDEDEDDDDDDDDEDEDDDDDDDDDDEGTGKEDDDDYDNEVDDYEIDDDEYDGKVDGDEDGGKVDDDAAIPELNPYNSSPHFSSDQQDESLLDCDHPSICKLPVVPLFWCNNEEQSCEEFECGACEMEMPSASYFACQQCGKKFHKECVESPLVIKHPSHPSHSLRLYSFASREMKCICCKEVVFDMFYHCTTCDLSMHPVCAMKTVPCVSDHPKSHHHPLTLFPAQASLVCTYCAMIEKLDPTYICIECVFVIHEGCIGFPHVIRISRHPHRISFTSSLPSGNLSCGVCRKQVDNNYGAYSCKKCAAYFVHSKCATHKYIWDGIELAGIPEEEDEIDDGEPFKRIADGIILHPFHSHHLQLEIDDASDIIKYCRGCALPIGEDEFYSCMECDFILHGSCANAPRMIRHPLYPHPLTLYVANMVPANAKGTFFCDKCHRDGTGFFYWHSVGEDSFCLDLQCASIIEPFEYQGHQHPLFLPWNPDEKRTLCQMCKYESNLSKLECTICNYSICYRCAALPYKVRYKHDNHFLTICDGKEASDLPDWCENCEGKIEEVKETGYRPLSYEKTERRFYNCSDCCTPLHVDCLLGKDMYMRPGNTKKEYLSYSMYSYRHDRQIKLNVRILLNDSLSRPICTRCKRRCPFPIVFKGKSTLFCSWNCIGRNINFKST
ncbi:PREDICTED: uncharacterized protein LOC104761629 [Camelina sativa]|uniref:Uncharacterized protein LOC104761629 n=1 Tax=Camelina sativa TaxID=90675 RepID=A0ABM0XAF6_CAMSA|nr:PREDICTED: uncharacterized protein LOC104761629 [Camelina sativa]